MDERVITYFEGEMPEKERIGFLREMDMNPALKEDMLSYQNIQAILSLTPESINTKAGHAGLSRFMKMKRKKTLGRHIRKTAIYAAACSLLITLTWIIAVNQLPEKQTAGQQELHVPAGQRARITLPDGSVVWLNAGSTLIYPSVFESERKVSLTGEGYFDVAAHPDKPFIVSAGAVDIMALGTLFDVYNYPEAGYISTSLIRGAVKVYKPNGSPEEIVLRPNQQLFYEHGQFRLETFLDEGKLLWKEGIYSFKKEPIDKIIKKLELYYDVKIQVKDPQILTYEYTGKFRQNDGVLEILRIIQKIHPFKIEKDDTLNQITLSR